MADAVTTALDGLVFELDVETAALSRAGQAAVAFVVERTARGVDRHGQPFRPYSTEPFAMPAGATTKAARKRLEGLQLVDYFQTREGALWMLVRGGYAALKAARYPQDGGLVNLWAEGHMMQALGVVDIEEGGDTPTVTVGFTRAEETQKARWNIETRDFMGLTSEEEAAVEGIALGGLVLRVGSQELRLS